MARRSILSNNGSANGHGGLPDFMVLNQLKEMQTNARTMGREFFQQFFDPRRNIDDECGYPNVMSVTPERYQELYEREAIAARVIEVMAMESWQVQPEIYETEDERETEFEQDWDSISQMLRGENSWYQDERGSIVMDYLRRLDIISGIGRYGVMLLGLDDGKDFREEAKPKKGQQLLYLRVFPESLAQISSYEQDPKSPRFGQPVQYLLTFNDPRETQGGAGLSQASANVHWSRIIHVPSDGAVSSSETHGTPRLRPVLRRVIDLEKEYASDGEAFWQNVVRQIYFETHPQLGGDVDIDKESMRDVMENMQNGLQRWGAFSGMSAKTLPPQMADPTPHINIQIEAICIKLGIPVPVFKGYEIGEQASTENRADWNERLKQRNNTRCTPQIVTPLVDRLIYLGVCRPPAKGAGYSVYWQPLDTQSAQEKAQVGLIQMQTDAAYISGGVESIMVPHDYLTKVRGFEAEEAEAILESAAELIEEKMLEAEAVADEHGMEPAAPEGFEKPEEKPPIKVKEGEKLVKP